MYNGSLLERHNIQSHYISPSKFQNNSLERKKERKKEVARLETVEKIERQRNHIDQDF